MKSYCKFMPGRFVTELPIGTKLVSLYDLTKKTPMKSFRYDPVEIIADPIPPFRAEYCPRSYLACCGSCTYRCTSRCLQDIATRLHYLSQAQEVGQTVRDMAAKLLDQELTESVHHQMLSLVDEIFCSPKGRRLNRQHGKLDYAARLQYWQDEKGRSRVKVDPITGGVLVHDWPSSGLCPYCIPRSNRKGYIRDDSPF